ncbi:MAG: hypothetical protein AAGE84_30285 [Cyanobacteria bacterium P01_G01_bin.39]
MLSKVQLQSWLENDEINIPSSVLIKIFAERNERADVNLKLNQTNFGLNAKLKSLSKDLTDWSKSEVVQRFKDLFGMVTKADDKLMGEIGAVSKESVREDLERAEDIVNDAQDIANQYRKKYGEL